MADEDWGRMDWLMDDAIVPAAGLSLARMIVRPGRTSPAHRDSNCAEAIHVLSGEIEQRVGDAWRSAAAGETVHVPIGVPHQTRNAGPDDAVLMVAYSAGARVYDEVAE